MADPNRTLSGNAASCHACKASGRAAATCRRLQGGRREGKGCSECRRCAIRCGGGCRRWPAPLTKKEAVWGDRPLLARLSRCGVSTVSPNEGYADLLARSRLGSATHLCLGCRLRLLVD